MATPEIDPQQFRKRVQRIRDAWSWSLDAFVLVTGKGQDGIGNEDENFKATAMHLWLFGLEFTETVLGVLKSGKLVLVTSQKKIKYLRDLEGPEVVLIPRTSSTELDDAQLQAFGSALRGENAQVTVGALLTATPSSPLAKCLGQALPTLQGITVKQCGGELAALLAPKDEEELALTRKSAFCSQHLLKQLVIARLEEIVDCDLVLTNKQVQDELMGKMENEDEMEKWLQSDKIDVGEVEVVFLSVQSGTSFEIKPDAGASQEKVPMQGTYLLSLGMKYHCYTSCVARTLIIDPTPAQRTAYDVVVSVHQLVVERLRPGAMFKDVYLAAKEKVHEELPALEENFVKNVGFLTGLGLKDPLYILDEGNEQKVQPGMVFCVSVGFTEVGKWSAWLADTAIVPLQDGPCEVPTSLCTNSPMEVMFNLGEDPVEDPPPPPQPQRPPAADPKSKASSAARSEQPAKAKAQPAGPAKAAAPKGRASAKPKAKAPPPKSRRESSRPEEKPRKTAREPAPATTANKVVSNRTRSRNQQTTQDMREQAQLEEKQVALRRKKLAELKTRFSTPNAGSKTKQAGGAKKLHECEAYSGPGDVPAVQKHRLRVDEAAGVLLVPVRGAVVPFHASTVKNMARSTLDGLEYLRVNFFSPGQGKSAEDFPKAGGRRLYLKELSFHSHSKENLDAVVRSFKEVQKRMRQREAEAEARRKSGADVRSREQTPLQVAKGGPKLQGVNMRPTLGGNARRTVGDLEAHPNGFRFSTKGGAEKVDVLYSQIRHMIYQPCESGSLVILIHLHLKEAMVCGKRTTQDLQFFTEVLSLTEDLSLKRAGSAHDPDELYEEQREREMKEVLNKQFHDFTKKVEKIPGCPIQVDIPFEELGFSGVPFKQVVRLTPCQKALVALQDWPPFCLSIEDVDIAVFERAIMSLREFDLVFVRKDYEQLPIRITTIPSNCLSTIKRWLGQLDTVWYMCAMNMQWQMVMKEILRDTTEFVEKGGWEQWFADGQAESESADDDADDESDYKDSGASDDDESDDNDDGESDFSAPDDDEESDALGDNDDEDGMSWDELEKEAERSDRKRDREGGHSAGATRQQPPRKTARKR